MLGMANQYNYVLAADTVFNGGDSFAFNGYEVAQKREVPAAKALGPSGLSTFTTRISESVTTTA